MPDHRNNQGEIAMTVIRVVMSIFVVSVMVFGGASPTIADNLQSDQSIAHGLSQMPLEEKKNAKIELGLAKDASDQAMTVAREIEKRWNDGAFTTALESFDQLAVLTDMKQAVLYGEWRTPVLTTQPERFGTDALMSTRDSVLEVELEVHLESGNLIGIILIEGEGWTNKMFSVLSTNGGLTWYEKTFVVSSSAFASISAAMLDDYCFVAFHHNSDIKLMRYRYDTGHKEDWSPGVFELTAHSGDFGEVKLVSNDDWDGWDDLHLVIRHLTREVTLYRFDPSLQTFHWMATEITDCDRGLAAVAGSSMWFPVYISYISQNNNVKILRYEVTQSKFVLQYNGYLWGTAPDATALGMYGLDVVCVYEFYHTATSSTYLMGAYSADMGDSWGIQAASGWGENRYEPNLTMRGGAGVALVFSRRISIFKVGRYKWRPYDDPNLGDAPATAYADNWTTLSPDIEYVGDGDHGIAYISSTSYRQAWFDRGSLCCQLGGDVNHSGGIDVSDLGYIVDYLFRSGPPPPCPGEGDVNGSGGIDVSDLGYIVDYLFRGGPAPGPCD